VGNRHLRVADLARDTRRDPFVLRMAKAMHEDDGDTAQPLAPQGLEHFTGFARVDGHQDRAIGADALMHLPDLRVQQFGRTMSGQRYADGPW